MNPSLPEISAEDAQNRQWDVIIAGTSFAAMFFLRALPAGLSILLVEKGRYQPHETQLQRGIDGLEDFRQINHSPHEKTWTAHTSFGGNSNCWWACTPRFHPNDFQLKTLYGVGDDWPVSYEDLAPFYQEVEEIMEVAGGGSDHLLPRDHPFPFPPHAASRSDQLLRNGSVNWFAQPAARSNGGSRPQCCANGVCKICPIDAKFTIANGINAFARSEVFLLSETEMRFVEVQAGRATGAQLRSSGREFTVSANIVALATNAIFNAAILLRSDIENPAIGAGLSEQLAALAIVDGPGLGYYGGTSITGHGYDLYDGPHRAEAAAALLEVHNFLLPGDFSEFLRTDKGRWGERMRMKIIVEDLPQAQNRVILEHDEPLIEWHGHHKYAYAGLERAQSRLPEILPFEPENIRILPPTETEEHMIGTHRIGHVTEDDLSVRGADGLYALGSGNFPTTSPANPTLTLAALSLRAGRKII